MQTTHKKDEKISCKDVSFGFLWRSSWRLQSSGTWRRVVSQISKMFWKNPLCSSPGYLKTGAIHSSETSVISYTTMLQILDRYSSVSRTCGCCTIVQESEWLLSEWMALCTLLQSNGHCMLRSGISGGIHQWRGTTLQAGRSRVRFPMVSLEFFVGIILPAALWPWGRFSLWQK